MKKIMNIVAPSFLLIFAISSPVNATPLFDSEDPVSIQIVAPLKSLKKQRGDDPQWLQGQVIVKGTDGENKTLDVKLKARGNFRRQQKTCPFPPFWLNFKKDQVAGTVFEGQDRLKVVSHCRERAKNFESYIYREYLAYKTYNLVTDKSFRVRLASINYQDTESKYRKEAQVGFFIEHVETFERRHQAKLIKERYVIPSLYDEHDRCLAEIFQYFVSNTDFTFVSSRDECCHNGKPFLFEDGSRKHLPVAYDFDLAGLVNAPYAKINPALKKWGVKKVTDRFYRGLRVSDEILEETLSLYKMKRPEIYALWENFEPLNDKHRLEALDFIDAFYEIIEDPKKVQTELKEKMRSIESLDENIRNKIEAAKKNPASKD